MRTLKNIFKDTCEQMIFPGILGFSIAYVMFPLDYYWSKPSVAYASQFVDYKRLKTPQDKSFVHHLINSAKAYDVPVKIALAISKQESNHNMKAVRYEPSAMKYARKVAPKGAGWDELKRVSSSYCAMQILAVNARELGFHEKELMRPEVCADTSMYLFARNMDRCEGRGGSGNKLSVLRCAAKMYNGSGRQAEIYSEKILRIAYGKT